MKKYLLALLACSLLAVVCCQDENAIDKEKKAIIAVLEAEKHAYYTQDLSGLDGSWVQDPAKRRRGRAQGHRKGRDRASRPQAAA